MLSTTVLHALPDGWAPELKTILFESEVALEFESFLKLARETNVWTGARSFNRREVFLPNNCRRGSPARCCID